MQSTQLERNFIGIYSEGNYIKDNESPNYKENFQRLKLLALEV
jgi:hypothetical protein